MLKLKNFIVESVNEMKSKVTWPPYKQLQNSSILVLVASLIFALVIWVIDYAFKLGLQDWFYKI